MISERERVELVRRIRALEREYFPDFSEQILGMKAVEGLITYGLNQNTLHREGWLEKQVKSKCENHLRNSVHKGDKQVQKLVKVLDKQIQPKKPLYDPPRRLTAKDCRHSISFNFSSIPDYQEQHEFFRVAFLALGFEFEARIKKIAWKKFLDEAGKSNRWEATVTGELEGETAHGFLIQQAEIRLKSHRQGAVAK